MFIPRRQPRAGPDGGDGGHGGSVILVADGSYKELAHVKKHNKAGDGEAGQQNDCHGRSASDLLIKVGNFRSTDSVDNIVPLSLVLTSDDSV